MINNKNLLKKILLISLTFFSFSLYAENIKFSTDSMTGSISSKNNTTILKGNAKVITDSIEISADEIQISGENYRYIKATGNVCGSSDSFDFTCGLLTYDQTTKKANLQNDVTLIDEENNVRAQAEIIEYNQETEIAVMQISVNIQQDENTCLASYAIYRKKDQMLDLSGNPNIKQKDDIFRAQQISLNLNTQQITLDGRVRGSVNTDSSSGEKNEEKK